MIKMSRNPPELSIGSSRISTLKRPGTCIIIKALNAVHRYRPYAAALIIVHFNHCIYLSRYNSYRPITTKVVCA